METLLKAINDILESKNTDISLLKWENERLKKEIAELKVDIEKYKAKEVNSI